MVDDVAAALKQNQFRRSVKFVQIEENAREQMQRTLEGAHWMHIRCAEKIYSKEADKLCSIRVLRS